jgi:hypothetical protein
VAIRPRGGVASTARAGASTASAGRAGTECRGPAGAIGGPAATLRAAASAVRAARVASDELRAAVAVVTSLSRRARGTLAGAAVVDSSAGGVDVWGGDG